MSGTCMYPQGGIEFTDSDSSTGESERSSSPYGSDTKQERTEEPEECEMYYCEWSKTEVPSCCEWCQGMGRANKKNCRCEIGTDVFERLLTRDSWGANQVFSELVEFAYPNPNLLPQRCDVTLLMPTDAAFFEPNLPPGFKTTLFQDRALARRYVDLHILTDIYTIEDLQAAASDGETVNSGLQFLVKNPEMPAVVGTGPLEHLVYNQIVTPLLTRQTDNAGILLGGPGWNFYSTFGPDTTFLYEDRRDTINIAKVIQGNLKMDNSIAHTIDVLLNPAECTTLYETGTNNLAARVSCEPIIPCSNDDNTFGCGFDSQPHCGYADPLVTEITNCPSRSHTDTTNDAREVQSDNHAEACAETCQTQPHMNNLCSVNPSKNLPCSYFDVDAPTKNLEAGGSLFGGWSTAYHPERKTMWVLTGQPGTNMGLMSIEMGPAHMFSPEGAPIDPTEQPINSGPIVHKVCGFDKDGDNWCGNNQAFTPDDNWYFTSMTYYHDFGLPSTDEDDRDLILITFGADENDNDGAVYEIDITNWYDTWQVELNIRCDFENSGAPQCRKAPGTNSAPPRRAYQCGQLYDGHRWFFVGGILDSAQFAKDVWEFDIDRNEWTHHCPNGECGQPQGEEPTLDGNDAMPISCDLWGDNIYVLNNHVGNAQERLWRLDLTHYPPEWYPVCTEMTVPGFDEDPHSCGTVSPWNSGPQVQSTIEETSKRSIQIVDGMLYVLGGVKMGGQSVWTLDLRGPSRPTWRRVCEDDSVAGGVAQCSTEFANGPYASLGTAAPVSTELVGDRIIVFTAAHDWMWEWQTRAINTDVRTMLSHPTLARIWPTDRPFPRNTVFDEHHNDFVGTR